MAEFFGTRVAVCRSEFWWLRAKGIWACYPIIPLAYKYPVTSSACITLLKESLAYCDSSF
jgi:hypothetical protein